MFTSTGLTILNELDRIEAALAERFQYDTGLPIPLVITQRIRRYVATPFLHVAIDVPAIVGDLDPAIDLDYLSATIDQGTIDFDGNATHTLFLNYDIPIPGNASRRFMGCVNHTARASSNKEPGQAVRRLASDVCFEDIGEHGRVCVTQQLIDALTVVLKTVESGGQIVASELMAAAGAEPDHNQPGAYWYPITPCGEHDENTIDGQAFTLRVAI